MAISALPTPPSRNDASTFSSRADSFLGALPTFATEANALAVETNGYFTNAQAAAAQAIAAIGYANAADISTSSVSIGTGSKSFTVSAGKSWVANMPVTITYNSSNYMLGRITSYSSTTLVVNVEAAVGSGTVASWSIYPQTWYREIPIVSVIAAYGITLPDSGKAILHPSGDTTARIWTIPANASVAFPIGTTLTFINQNAGGVITLAITSDTMRLAGPGTTGSRTLAANCVATAIKIAATEWIISGTNLT